MQAFPGCWFAIFNENGAVQKARLGLPVSTNGYAVLQFFASTVFSNSPSILFDLPYRAGQLQGVHLHELP
jgi:hypothetical protein